MEVGERAADVRAKAPGSADGPAVAQTPVNDYLDLEWRQRRSLILAEQLLIEQCMESEGFEFLVNAPPVDDPGTDQVPDDETEAARLEWEAYFEGLTETERAAWNAAYNSGEGVLLGDTGLGYNAGGCLHESQQTLYGDRHQYFLLRAQIEQWGNQATEAAIQSAAGQNAQDAWIDCMADAGYPDVDPNPPPNDDASNYPQEVAEACAETHSVESILVAAVTAEQEEVLARHELEIQEWLDLREQAVQRAFDLLADS